MKPTRTEDGVLLGGDARDRFYAARGYGEPVGESQLRLRPLEAAYLLFRGDIPAIDGDGFATFCRQTAALGFLARFMTYKDLRERGFYLSPREDQSDDVDLEVYERGSHPSEDRVVYEVRVLDERQALETESLRPGVLAMVDEEGEVGYVSVEPYVPKGPSSDLPDGTSPAEIVGDRVVLWDPPPALYADSFFGQPIAGRDAREEALQLSLVEASYLAERDSIELGAETIRQRGLEVQTPQRFNTRASVYTALRDAGAVPKTGFKFGADFRVYHEFEGIDEMGHSDVLVRILDRDVSIDPSDIALDVRLAHGVGKRMVFALPRDSRTTPIDWLSVTRVTP